MTIEEQQYVSDVLSSLLDTSNYEYSNIDVTALYIIKVVNVTQEEIDLLRLYIASGGEYSYFHEMYKDEADIMEWRAEMLFDEIANVAYNMLPNVQFPVTLLPVAIEGMLVYSIIPNGDNRALIILQHYKREDYYEYRKVKFG